MLSEECGATAGFQKSERRVRLDSKRKSFRPNRGYADNKTGAEAVLKDPGEYPLAVDGTVEALRR
jgi:hypothetical protein